MQIPEDPRTMGELIQGRLSDRGVVAVSGTDAKAFLQDLVTGDMTRLAPERPGAIHAALLTPQGKILFEFFISHDAVSNGPGPYGEVGDRFLLDVAHDQVADLIKRLAMYKLRAKVDLADVSGSRAVYWSNETAADASGRSDPRDPRLGQRWIAEHGAQLDVTPQAYHDRRVECGIAELGHDFEPASVFPHDVNFDLTHSVDFRKGCFIGQEVVSRMQHKAVARKRAARIEAMSGTLTSDAPVAAGTAQLGSLGTIHTGRRLAIARLRIDRVAEIAAAGGQITAGDTTIAVDERMVAAYEQAAAAKGER